MTSLELEEYIEEYFYNYKIKYMCTRMTIWLLSFCWFIYSNVWLVKVIDWDTIKVNIEWTITNVRMLWIDAPEKSTLRYWHAEKWWVASYKHLKKLLKWKEITLKCKKYQDKYSRDLCIAFGDGKNINNQMLKDWYAKRF